MPGMKLVVFGSTGRTGRLVVADALRRGHVVTAFARTPEALGDLRGGCARVVRGDVVDRVAVAEAVAGQEAVVYAIGPSPDTVPPPFAEGALRVIRAMQHYGVRRLVALSASGLVTDEDQGRRSFLSRLLRPRARAVDEGEVRRMEVTVRQSGLDWTLVRPSPLTDGPATGTCRAGPGHTLPDARPIARADVAAYLLDQLATDLNVRHAVALSG
mgnify:CR=1 FL=1